MRTDKYGNECSKRLPVGIYTLSTMSFDYFVSLTFAEQLYGKHGILFDVVDQRCLALSAAQQVSLAVIDGTCEWDQNNSEQDDLHALVSAPPGRLCVFIVGGIQKPDGPLAGCAGHAPDTPAVVVSGAMGTNYTLAHEIGHVLLTSSYSPVHETSTSNIMVGGTWRIPANSSPDFDADQVRQILTSNLLVDV